MSDDAISEAFATWERARQNVQELEARLAAARLAGSPQVVADLSAEFELRKRQADGLLAKALELVKEKPGTP